MSAPTQSAPEEEYLHPALNRLFGHLRHVLQRTGSLRKHIADLLGEPVAPRWWLYRAPDETLDYKDLRVGQAREQGRAFPDLRRLAAEFGPVRQRDNGTIELSVDEPSGGKPTRGVYARLLSFSEVHRELERFRVDRAACRLDAFHLFLRKWRGAIVDARKALSAAVADLDGKSRLPVAERPSTHVGRVLDRLSDAVPWAKFDVPDVVAAQPEWIKALDAASPAVRDLVVELRSPATLPALPSGTRHKQEAVVGRDPSQRIRSSGPRKKLSRKKKRRMAAQPFVPTPLQKLILEKLNGKALRTEALRRAMGLKDRRKLFKAGGLNELRDIGLVVNHRRLGYFRTDAPPPEHADALAQMGTKAAPRRP